MKFCSAYDATTHLASWQSDGATYCRDCGTELTPEIRCLCGADSYNPKAPLQGKFCVGCGAEWTPAYLAQCMSAQLKEMVQNINQQRSMAAQSSQN